LNKKKSLLSKLTIVGGQPSPKNPPLFNTNIEKFLLKASSDRNLKEALLKGQKKILENPEFSLSPQDRKILESIPSERLENMIEKLSCQKTSRRHFLRGAAASVALIATGSLLGPALAQTPSPPTGISPDYPPQVTPTPATPQELIWKTGPEGGTINYTSTGLKIVIPPEALEETLDIKIEIIAPSDLYPESEFIHSEVYQFSPGDLEFSKEISIYFPEGNLAGLPVKAYLFKNPEDSLCEAEEFSVEITDDNYFLLRTETLGIYTVGLKREAPYPSPTRGIDTDY